MKTDGRLVRLFNTKGGISMKSYAADKVRNVVLLGHSGSGKTTYAEAALFYSGATKRFGKVDEGNTVSDYDPLSRISLLLRNRTAPVSYTHLDVYKRQVQCR